MIQTSGGSAPGHHALVHGRPDRLIEDAMIAATAQVHGLTVVTRNVRDFQPFDVPTFDPF